MSMIFRFRMLCDEDDYFLREYEVPYDMTLSDFREFIDRDVHYRSDSVTSFSRQTASGTDWMNLPPST